MHNVEKYLSTYGEPWSSFSSDLPEGYWQHGVTIAAYRERKTLPRCLEALEKAAKKAATTALVAVVVNHRTCSPEEVKSDNRETLQWLKDWPVQSPLTVLAVDRASPGLEFTSKSGVGLARKIGADLLLHLWSKKRIATPILYHTDGDTAVGLDYFQRFSNYKTGTWAAGIFPFVHVQDQSDELTWQALQLYVQSLRYYVDGLNFAGSPYAFQTVGSTLAIDAQAYAEVRGFPDVQAAEDFHMLNKLSKVGPIISMEGDPLAIAARRSDRVPFGTGAATGKIAGLLGSTQSYEYYDPKIFLWLRLFLSATQSLVTSRTEEDPREFLAKTVLAAVDDPGKIAIDRATVDLGVVAAMERSRKASPRTEVRLRQWHHWFDALKTLRFIHICRDHGAPQMELSEAIRRSQELFASTPTLVGLDAPVTT